MKRLEWLAREGTVFLSVSGGKDSTAAAVRAVEILEKVAPEARVFMVYAHTPLALPENLEYVERLADWLGVELIVARPREGLEVIEKRGWPSPMRRWCMYRWKLEPIIESIKRHPTPHLHVVGVRTGESRRRLTLYSGRDPREPWFYCLRHGNYCAYYWSPILDWSGEQVWAYIEERGIPRNPLWGMNGHSSHDCVVCLPFAKRREYLRLKTEHPEIWDRLYTVYRRMNRARRRGAKILAWSYTDLDEVARAKTLEDYMEARSKCRACLVTELAPG